MILDRNRTVTHTYRYGTFGDVTNQTQQFEQPFKYVGKYGVQYDLQNLYYMRNRCYNPYYGRFYSEDPVWSTNLFPYADNNPIMNVDPDGTQAVAVAETFVAEIPVIIDGVKIIITAVASALTISKVKAEIEKLKNRKSNKNGIVYSLRASKDGYYPDYNTGKMIFLRKGDIWKYGESTNPLYRYTGKFLKYTGAGLYMNFEVDPCEQYDCKAIEKNFILEYYTINGRKPPGNKLFR